MKVKRTAIEECVIRRLGAALEAAPWGACRRVGSIFGLAFFYGSKRRRSIATSNLHLVYPRLTQAAVQRLARRSAQNFGMSFCEFLHLRTASPQEIAAYCDWQGDSFERIQQEMALGNGLVLPTAHFGAWEVMGARAAQEFPLTVVVRLTSNQALLDHIKKVRQAINLDMILKSETARASLSVLHSKGALAIFPDQHGGINGVDMPVFGHMTRVISSPARLALTTGAPIMPTFGVRRTPWLRDGRVVIHATPALRLDRKKFANREEAVLEGTRFITSATEQIISKYPDQWLWMHRRWRAEDQF